MGLSSPVTRSVTGEVARVARRRGCERSELAELFLLRKFASLMPPPSPFGRHLPRSTSFRMGGLFPFAIPLQAIGRREWQAIKKRATFACDP